jgi:type I restriction enzyme S subunit
MTGKQLKNSILQWAIQGKLVPQDPNDEPASVLLEKIRAEKARLVKEKKIKKDKNESIIYRGEDNSYYEKLADGTVKCIDDEIPFEIPQGWEWCRMERLCSLFSTGPFGTMVHKSDYTEEGVPLVNPTNIKEQKITSSNICKVSLSKYKELKSYVLSENDIILARRGDLSKCAIINKEQSGWLAGTGSFFLHILGISPDFFILLYTSPYAQMFLLGDSVGTTMNNLNQGLLSRMMIPIPPLLEQKRIVVQYRFIIPLLQKYDLTYSQRKLLDGALPLRIKKSILQEAIQGKLVPQIASEGTAQELLEQIQQEKLRLVKEGVLKKSTLASSVIFKGDDNKYYEKVGRDVVDITEEIPFEIPSTWCWCRGKTIFLPMQSTKPISDFIYIDVDAVNNKTNTIDNPKNIQLEVAPSRATRKLECNDVLFSMVRPYLRNIAIIHEQYANAIASTGFYVIRPTVALYPQYLFRMMLSSYVVDGLNKFMKGENSPSINNNHIENYLYPLPPFNEQKRIVEHLDLLFQQIR